MCGVIGYVGEKPCVELIFKGLKLLEYRGYDSSGIAVLEDSAISVIKSEGKLDKLEPLLSDLSQDATLGMGHTRWATHGAPTKVNAHPHREQGLAVIHNGILENYQDLKIELLEKGVRFQSDTDTEVFVHLLYQELAFVPDVRKALLKLTQRLRGAYGLGILSACDPEALYVVKQGSPLVLGVGDGENFFASDAIALVGHTRRVIFLEDGEMARISKEGVQVWNFQGEPVQKIPIVLDWSQAQAEKHGFRHYMLKEIHEQPSVIANTLDRAATVQSAGQLLDRLGVAGVDFFKFDRIQVTACGTAFLAGMVGKYVLESLLKVPVSVDLASELRYQAPCLNEKTLLIAITQSGETADTLASVKLARAFGSQVLSVCNMKFSSIARESTASLYMEAGPEIGVASTKAFTAMVLNLYLLALAVARLKEQISQEQFSGSLLSLRKLPPLVDQAVAGEARTLVLAQKVCEATNALFVGRGCSYPIALEGALKLKEISYIHAEGYAGGELKHGPIALIDKSMPVIAVVPRDRHREKMLSNVEEIRARDGWIIGVGAEDDNVFRSLCSEYLPCPQIDEEPLQAILSIIPLQLFAYNVAVLRGTDVDQPRNLAKSVTVE
ncbi:MAG: glutamine--fructose-6-phosphate transaminase (isomerizing) [Deltaproteobacteria bacterium]|nr:glutamine--fructose-6-phosphate transaminase (isomerizing) [Deltaproteobacteria bacterium]